MRTLFMKGFILCFLFTFAICDEKITYVSIERPQVTYTNPKMVSFANITSQRYGRRSQVYYVGLHYTTLVPVDNSFRVDFYFYEFLTNQYKPSFVEMHFRWCNLIHNDMFFGAAMKQGKLDAPCPYPPGDYNLYNMTILPDAIPKGFPFTKGRIYANITKVTTKEFVASGHVDMEIRQLKVKNRVKNKKL